MMEEGIKQESRWIMGSPLIINIQRYSIHDGDGIRSTVFFKGCPLSCRWCHNPESQRFAPEILFHADRCTGCGACESACTQGALEDRAACTGCGACADVCLHDARERVGEPMSVTELCTLLERDLPFYEESGGGVTLSGGEAAAQDMDYLEALCRHLTRAGIRVNLDTCGHVGSQRLLRLLPYIDVFLYDVKLIDSARHREWTGVGNERILENLVLLHSKGAKIDVRIPVIGGANADGENIRQTAAFLRREAPGIRRVYLLPYHAAGAGKYAQLGRRYEGDTFFRPDHKALEAMQAIFAEEGISPCIF